MINIKKRNSGLSIARDHLIGELYFPEFDRVMLPHINRFGFWENVESRFIARILPRSGTFLNIGSNVGYHLLSAKIRRPDCRVIGVEPHPSLAELSLMNANIHGVEITLHQVAIAKDNEQRTLYSSSYNSGDSRLKPFSEANSSTNVQVISGADLISRIDGNIDVILIDTQGSEIEIIESLDIPIHSRTIVIFEFTPELGEARKGCFESLRNLAQSGWSLYELNDDFGVETSHTRVESEFEANQDLEYVNLMIRRFEY